MTLFDRIQRRVAIDQQTNCWIWTGAKTPGGYGKIGVGQRTVYTHRATYECANGPIPVGYHIDHLCRETRCCNPKHLEAVTCRTNILRGNGLSARRASQTHCKRGHEFTSENTYRWRNHRYCRLCQSKGGKLVETA